MLKSLCQLDLKPPQFRDVNQIPIDSEDKKNQRKENDAFYIRKRGLFRKAEQLTKNSNSDVFIVVHNKDTDKFFSFTSHKDFNLQKISSRLLKDLQTASFLKKNQKFETEDFDTIFHNIKEITNIISQIKQETNSQTPSINEREDPQEVRQDQQTSFQTPKQKEQKSLNGLT